MKFVNASPASDAVSFALSMKSPPPLELLGVLYDGGDDGNGSGVVGAGVEDVGAGAGAGAGGAPPLSPPVPPPCGGVYAFG